MDITSLIDWIDENKLKLNSKDYLDLMNLLQKLHGYPLPFSPHKEENTTDEELSCSYNDEYIEEYI